MMIIAACIFTLAGFSATASGGFEQEKPVSQVNSSNELVQPPIDIVVLDEIETATFGLG